MAVNTSKTKFIIFHTKGKKIDFKNEKLVFDTNEFGKLPDPSLVREIDRIHNNGTEKAFKLLGVLLDENLTFSAHVNYIGKKISKSLYCIKKVKHLLPKAALKTLYYSMVHPHILYAITIYSCAAKTNLNPILLQQKKAIRLISNAKYNDHTAPLFKELKILPFDKLVNFANLKFFHQYANGLLPESFKNLWRKNSERNTNMSLRNQNDYMIPFNRIEITKRFPLTAMPTIWNETDDVKLTGNYTTFKITLKKNLLESIVNIAQTN